MDIADAAAKVAILVNRDENSVHLRHRRIHDLWKPRRLPRQIRTDGIARNLQKQLLIVFSELECYWSRHDDAASFPTDSSAAARVP